MSPNKYNLYRFFFHFLEELGVSHEVAQKGAFGISFLLVVSIFLVTVLGTRKLAVRYLYSTLKKKKIAWGDQLEKTGILSQIVYIVPVIITKVTIEMFFSGFDLLLEVSHKVINIFVLVIVTNALRKIVDLLASGIRTNSYNLIAIQGISQIIKISIYVLGGISLISILLDLNLQTIFAGLGAVAAVLILVFKDTILGFVSSIQIASSKIVKVGDWVSMPQYNIDGTVLDITLFSTKVQNWDKTINSIPTFKLMSSSIKNWKGMERSKVRRIKKHINIDASSIKFCDKSTLEKLKKYDLLKDFIPQREEEIKNYNHQINANKEFAINGRNLTNIGLFRNYGELYLKKHPQICNTETLMVRLLQPTTEGIPMEIYCFCKDTDWVNYENIQSDVLDHLLSSVVDFDLKIFQLRSIP